MKRLPIILSGSFVMLIHSAPHLLAQMPKGLELKPMVQQQPRTWTSVDGKEIEATLVSVAADHAMLRMADGKEHFVGRSRLSAEDNARLDDVARVAMKPMEKLLKQHEEDVAAKIQAASVPPKAYRFAINWDKVGSQNAEPSTGAVKSTGNPCAFRVTNLCGQGLLGALMIYQFQVRLDAGKSKGPFAYPAQVKPIYMVETNLPVLVRTKSLAELSAKLKPGEVVRDASGVIQPDDIAGVVVKIMHQNKVVHEFKSSPDTKDMVNFNEVIDEWNRERKAAGKASK